MAATAWFCPSCQKHHAPHVETCPGGTGGMPPLGDELVVEPFRSRPLVTPQPVRTTLLHYGYDPCANCRGACGNAACPKALRASYAAGTAFQ